MGSSSPSIHHPPTEEQTTTEEVQAIPYKVRPSFTNNIRTVQTKPLSESERTYINKQYYIAILDSFSLCSLLCIVCMITHTCSRSMDQSGKVAR